MPEWKFHVRYTFHHFSELPWLPLAAGKVVYVCSVTQLCLIFCDPKGPPGSSVHKIILARSQEWVVGCRLHFLLQRIFPTQGSNLHLCVSCFTVGFLTIEPWEEVPKECLRITNDFPLKLHQIKVTHHDWKPLLSFWNFLSQKIHYQEGKKKKNWQMSGRYGP